MTARWPGHGIRVTRAVGTGSSCSLKIVRVTTVLSPASRLVQCARPLGPGRTQSVTRRFTAGRALGVLATALPESPSESQCADRHGDRLTVRRPGSPSPSHESLARAAAAAAAAHWQRRCCRSLPEGGRGGKDKNSAALAQALRAAAARGRGPRLGHCHESAGASAVTQLSLPRSRRGGHESESAPCQWATDVTVTVLARH